MLVDEVGVKGTEDFLSLGQGPALGRTADDAAIASS